MPKRTLSEGKELIRQQKALSAGIGRLIRELKKRSAPQRPRSGLPYSLVEGAISWVLKQFERGVATLVAAVLNKVKRR